MIAIISAFALRQRPRHPCIHLSTHPLMYKLAYPHIHPYTYHSSGDPSIYSLSHQSTHQPTPLLTSSSMHHNLLYLSTRQPPLLIPNPYMHPHTSAFIDAHMHPCTRPSMCVSSMFTYTLLVYPSIHSLTRPSVYYLLRKVLL